MKHDESNAIDALMLDLLEWIGPAARPYAEVIEAWRTSCPRLPVWEEADARGFIEHREGAGGDPMVRVTEAGMDFLGDRRPREILP